MQRLATAGFCLLLNSIAMIPASSQPLTPILTDAPVNSIEIPESFVADAPAYIIVEGRFRSGCYKWVGAEVQQKPNFITEIHGFAQVSNGICIQMIIPFREKVPLGPLPAGTYDLHFMRADGSFLREVLTIQ